MLQSGQMPNATEQKQHQNGHKPHFESTGEEQQTGNVPRRTLADNVFARSRQSYDGNMNDTMIYELFFKHRYCFVRRLLFICLSVYTPDESKDSSLFTFQIGNKNQLMTTKISVMRNLSRRRAQSSGIESRLFSHSLADRCTDID